MQSRLDEEACFWRIAEVDEFGAEHRPCFETSSMEYSHPFTNDMHRPARLPAQSQLPVAFERALIDYSTWVTMFGDAGSGSEM